MCEAASSTRDGGDHLAELTDVAQRLAAGWREGRTPGQIGDDLVRLRHAIDLLEFAFSVDAAEFAATDESDLQGSNSPMDWIRHNCRTAHGVASSAICVGEAMASLPQSIVALMEGRIGFAHLSLLARTARAVGTSSSASGFDEEPLLGAAEEHSVSRFRHDCEHAHDAQAFLADHVNAVEDRSLELIPCENGGIAIRGFLDSVGGATVRTALEPLARRSGADDTREYKRRLADGLIELATHGLDSGELPRLGGVRPHLQVTTTLDTLRGLTGAPAGELEFCGPIPAATVQRLACDAGITRILLGPGSTVVDVGRERRVPAGGTRKALRARDQGCVWPGCERPASWTEVHHLEHWAYEHGVTEVPNLVLLCGRHHWKVHEGGWRIVRTDDASVRTIPPLPAWRPLPRAPDPAPNAA